MRSHNAQFHRQWLTASLVLAALLSAPMAARAEEGAAAKTTSSLSDTTRPVMFLKETVVTGSRFPRAYYESPQALSFISRRQIAESIPLVTGDVLADLPGVDNSKDAPWEQRPSIRGLSGQRVMVLVDGNPMNSMRGNGPHPSTVDPSQIDRIEVVRGPSSFSYGSDALGGAINIITRDARPGTGRSLKGGVTLTGSSVDKRTGVIGELSPRLGKFSAYVSGGGQTADDYKTPNGTVPGSAFSNYNWLANLRYDFTGKTFLKAGWQQYRAMDAGLPGLSGTPFPGYTMNFDFPFYNRDYAHVTLDHQYPNSTWINQTRVQFYWQREFRNFASDEFIDASNFPIFGVFGAPAGTQTRYTHQDRYFDLNTYGFRTQLTSAKTEHVRYTFGVDASRDMTDGDYLRFRQYQNAGGAALQTFNVVKTAPVPDGRFDNYAGFLQGEVYVTPKVTLSGGGRFTQYRYRTDFGVNQSGIPFTAQSRDDGALSGSIGAAWEVIPDLRLTGNVATGYREPNAQDLYFVGPASVGVVFGNDQLVPEKSVSYDAGLRWGPGPFAVSGNLFYSTYNDLIAALTLSPVPADKAAFVPPGQSAFQYTNIATATIWGGDLEAQARFFEHWNFRTQFAGQIGDITSREAILAIYGINADRVALESVTPFKGSTALRWTESSGRFWAEAGTRWAWRTNRLPPSQGVSQLTAFKKEYIVGDLAAGVNWSGQRLTLGIRNFTDRAYTPALASVEDPGLSFVGSLSTSF